LERAGELNATPIRWFDGVIYDGTVTYPIGKSNLTREEIRDTILAWAGKQKTSEKTEPIRILKAKKAVGHKSVLVGFVGLPASGKSFMVDVLCDACALLGKQVSVVSSDAVRKEGEEKPLGDKHKGVGYGKDIYTPKHDQENYAEVFRRAKTALREADLVIIDATLRKQMLRNKMLNTCCVFDTMIGFVEVLAPTEVLLGRSAARWFKPSMSDATPDILEVQLKEYEQLTSDECTDPRVDFVVSLFNSDSPEQMVQNTSDLVLWLLEMWFPEEIEAKKDDLKNRVECFIKSRLARLESKLVQPHAELLVKADLLNCIKCSADKDEAVVSFSKTWLNFFARRAPKIISL
jgi:predicted kinase